MEKTFIEMNFLYDHKTDVGLTTCYNDLTKMVFSVMYLLNIDISGNQDRNWPPRRDHMLEAVPRTQH